jgi:uncharacterized membrane protein YtjA (UPF0391 family)
LGIQLFEIQISELIDTTLQTEGLRHTSPGQSLGFISGALCCRLKACLMQFPSSLNDFLGTKPQRCVFWKSYVITGQKSSYQQTEKRMLKWAAIFLVIAIIAALFGFTGIAGAAADIARFLFFLFIAIFVVIFLLALFAGKKMF